MRRWLISIPLVLVMFGIAACGESHRFVGTVLEPPKDVSGLQLTNAEDAPEGFASQPKHLRLVYFGFTFCPDVCPATLMEVRDALDELDEKRSRIDTAMVTIDPARDSGPVLRDYVQRFVPNASALRTDDQTHLTAVTKAFGASYIVTPGPTPDRPEVSHSTWLYAVDERGQLIAQWPLGTKGKQLAADISVLLKRK